MKRAVFVTRDPGRFAPLKNVLADKGMDIEHTGSGRGLLDLLDRAAAPIPLILISSGLEDMPPKDLVAAVTEKSPFSHCVVAGNMDDKAFHDFFEGYGVLMQVGESPGPEDAEKLSAHLDRLTRLGIF